MLKTSNPSRIRCVLTPGRFAAAVVAIAVCTVARIALAQVACPSLQANGAVRAVKVADGRIYLGGDFTRVGRPTGGLVIADPVDAHPIAIPRVLGMVWAIAPDGSGGWFLGGNFSHVAGVARRNLARIAADGSLLDWNPGADSTVQALSVSAGKLYLGGHFLNAAGVPRSHVAAIDVATATATSWNPGANGDVLALAVQGDVVYIGGIFSSFLRAVSATTGAVTSWNPQPDGSVTSIVANGGTIYVAGNFNFFDSFYQRNRIAAIEATTGVPTAWNPNANNSVRAMTLAGGKLWAAGVFSSIGGAGRGRAAALDTTTGLASAWNPRVTTGLVLSIAVSNGTVYLGGTFSTLDGGKPRPRVAALDTTTGTASTWTIVNDATEVRAVAVGGGGVLVGGDLTAIDVVTRNHLAALDETTGALLSWNPDTDGTVNAIAVHGGNVYAGGLFGTVGAVSRSGLAEIDATSGAPTGWNPNPGGEVFALEVSGTSLYYSGASSFSGLNEVDLSTHLGTSFSPFPDGPVRALAVDGGLLYAGGDFHHIGGQARASLAAIDRATGTATAFNPNPQATTPTIAAISVLNGTIYVGGSYVGIGGASRIGLAALDPSGVATSWNPNSVFGVTALAIGGGVVYAAGNSAKALDLATGSALPWSADFAGGSGIQALGLSGSSVILGGNFTTLAGVPQRNVGCLGAAGTVGVEGPAATFRTGELRSVTPNPSRGAVRIEYALASRAPVRLQVVDVAGRVRAKLDEGIREAGAHTVEWSADRSRRLPSGVYFVVLDAGARRSVMRLIELQ